MNGVKRRRMLGVLPTATAAVASPRAAWAKGLLKRAETKSDRAPRPPLAIAEPVRGLAAEDPLLHSAAAWIDQLRRR
jgi:hypothetical protein